MHAGQFFALQDVCAAVESTKTSQFFTANQILMQTLLKYTLIVLLFATAWSCSDSLDLDFDDVKQIESSNSLTVAVQDPGNPNSIGTYQLVVEGPKEFNASYNVPQVNLKDLPAGNYRISVVSNGYVSYKKQVYIAETKGEGVDQRYRVEMPLVRRGADFKFSNATGGSVMFPEGTAVSSGASFPATSGISAYRNVVIDLPACALGSSNCVGESVLSASVIPMHADVIAGQIYAQGKTALFLLDLESAQSLRLSKDATVSFPVNFRDQSLRQMKYSLVRVERDAASGLPRLTSESVAVAINADGTRASAKISNLSADWMFVADAKMEVQESSKGFQSLARSARPGKSVSTSLSLRNGIDPIFAQLVGLVSTDLQVSESIQVDPGRDMNAEVFANYQVRNVRLVNSWTNSPVVNMGQISFYPLSFMVVLTTPHSSGGHDSGGHDSGGG